MFVIPCLADRFEVRAKPVESVGRAILRELGDELVDAPAKSTGLAEQIALSSP